MKIVFMGTPQFAVPALQKLLTSKHEIIGVYTREPKPAGRGQQVNKTPVHMLAEENNVKVYHPKTLRNADNIEELKALNADIIVVSAYGMILPKAVLEAFRFGAVNIHPSKLPRWRGASPIQRTIMAGDTETSICIMQMDEGLDTGDIILEKPYPVNEEITAKELMDYLATESGDLLLEALEQIEEGTVKLRKQSEEGVTYADKFTKEDELIDWKQDARAINCHIRTLSPKPGAYFMYKGEIIKIIVAEYSMESVKAAPGTVIDDKLTIACGSGVLKPKLLQRQGRKMIYTDAFLRGFAIHMGDML
jgi:methionyl-tRNA formyltransferase